MTLSSDVRAELAAELVEAERGKVPMKPLTDRYADLDVVDAYEIQLLNIRARVAAGARVVGHKVGLCTEDDVLAATAAFAPSIELIDTRIKDWKIKLCDTIADNASSAGWVLGKERVSPKDIDVKNVDAILTRNGEVVAEGRSDAVLGNPVTAVAWLARKIASFGVQLKAGDIILPGSCTKAIDARPGDGFVATFAGLGSVQLSFE
jgi:2-keto-4-pentenoate hydratase